VGDRGGGKGEGGRDVPRCHMYALSGGTDGGHSKEKPPGRLDVRKKKMKDPSRPVQRGNIAKKGKRRCRLRPGGIEGVRERGD